MKELYYKKVAGSTFTDYTYDKNGNLITAYAAAVSETSTLSVVKTETVNGVMTEYTYNELNQLTGQVSDTSETLYLYDERGNQIHAETINEDESVSTVDMEYSVMGEMTSRTEKSGTNTTLAQTNVYDQDGQRIKRTQNETARTYYYDSGVVLYTKDGSTISSANILSDSGAAIGTYRGNTYHTYLKDAQGSTTNLVRSDGTLTAAYDYTDFGETTELAGASFDNQIRYTGGIYDEEIGLYYLNARYYDPETGRFISQDSYRGEIDDPGQWHLYAYCANNPINYVDPSGHWRQTYTRNQAKNTYRLLRALDITTAVIPALGIKKVVKKIAKAISKRAYGELVDEVLEEARNDLLAMEVVTFYERLTEGFRKGGYESITLYKWKKRKKSGKVKTRYYEPVNRTKLVVYNIFKFRFYYTSKGINYYVSL